VACAGDLKEDFLLALEKDLAVIDASREKHQAVDFNELLRGKVAGPGNCSRHASCRDCKSHSLLPEVVQTQSISIVSTTFIHLRITHRLTENDGAALI
jgi:hypothetical protein